MEEVIMKDGFLNSLDFALEQLERQSELFEEAEMNAERIRTDTLIRELRQVIDKSERLVYFVNNGFDKM